MSQLEQLHGPLDVRKAAATELGVQRRIGATRQKINLEAFGFSGFPGLPTLVGPFNVVDMRVSLTQSVIDLLELRP